MIVFKGSAGLRSGWRFAAFMVATAALVFLLNGFVAGPIAAALHVDESGLNAKSFLFAEVFIFLDVFVVTAVAARLERRSILSYAGLVAVAMYAMGGFVIGSFALHGSDWIVLPVVWGVAMVLVGVAEESWFRGYPLQALARGTGFVIGTQNGGQRPGGTLLQASFPGPAWINGGLLGTEASYFMIPVMLLVLAYIHVRYPASSQGDLNRLAFR